MLDVTPLSLGIETLGQVMTRISDRNTTIPTRKSQIFSTAADSQTAVSILVLQGEREMAIDTRTLGRFDLVGIPPAPRGVPQIEVAFDIDANGIVHVSAKDLATGKEQKIVVQASSGLSDVEIDRMVKSASEHEEEDKRKRELIEARNNADNLIYTTEKALKEHAEKISDGDKTAVEEAIKALKDVKDGSDAEAIKARSEELSQAWYKIAETLYKSTAGAQGRQGGADAGGESGAGPGAGQAGAETSGKAEEAVDADYQVVDEEKEQSQEK